MISPAEVAAVPTRCPRCGGQMYCEVADEYGCLSCGEYIFVQRRRPTAPMCSTASPRNPVTAAPPSSPAA